MRLLFVDSPEWRLGGITKELLEALFPALSVQVVSDLGDALRFVYEHKPPIVIVAGRLGNTHSGPEILAELRLHNRHPCQEILVSGAPGFHEEAVRALDAVRKIHVLNSTEMTAVLPFLVRQIMGTSGAPTV